MGITTIAPAATIGPVTDASTLSVLGMAALPDGTLCDLIARVRAGDDAAWEPRAELLLMTAARVQHAAHVIRPGVAAGRIVVSDRYAGSTLAYQGAGRGMDEALIRGLHATMLDDLWPDLTLVLDLDPAIGLTRSRKRLSDEALDEGRFESLALPFHQRIRASFLAQAAAAPDRHAIIDADDTPEAVQDTAWHTVRDFLARGAART
mgnify:CR=1 FL=1